MFAVAVLAAALSVAAPPDVKARAKVHRFEQRLKDAAARTQDHTALFYKREHLDGELKPAEHILLKWRAAAPTRGPQLYMKWIAGHHKGRELLWRGDKQMKIKAGILTLDVDVDGALVRGQSRHSVREAGLVEMARMIAADIDRAQARKHRGVTYEDLGDKNVHGALAHCWAATLPKDEDPTFSAKRAEICIDARTSLPSVVKVWDDVDGRLTLVEDYSFADIQVNAGLTDEDFSPDNASYF